MKMKTTILLVGGVSLIIIAAGLLAKGVLYHGPSPVTYAAQGPVASAELERLLKKHGVPFTYTNGGRSSSKNGNATVTVTTNFSPPAFVIEDATAPNAVAAMKEFSSWSASPSSKINDPATNQ
jgi:hypothetical protein